MNKQFGRHNSNRVGANGNGRFQTIEGLEEVVSDYLKYFDGAIKRKALEPYNFEVRSFLSQLNRLIGSVKESRDLVPALQTIYSMNSRLYQTTIGFDDFCLEIPEEQVDQSLERLAQLVLDVESRDKKLTELCRSVKSEIQLEVRPNSFFHNEIVYLAQGFIVIPTYGPSDFQVYKISTFRCKDGNLHTELKQVSQRKYTSVDEAIRREINPNALGTLAIARNTGHYPLLETALPIVEYKYEHGLRMQLASNPQ